MMARRSPRSWRALLLLGALAGCACSGPPGNETFVPNNLPTTDGFTSPTPALPDRAPVVSDALEMHCGTLDCHGDTARNLRIYGINGLRAKGLVPGGDPTSDEEHLLTYESIVAIQPEILNRIVFEHGAHPERWMIITKGRGSEHHKGGSPMRLNDDTDHCITSWLTGAVDREACTRSYDFQPPGGPAF